MKIKKIYHFKIPIIPMETMEKAEWSSMADNMASLQVNDDPPGIYQMDNLSLTF